MSIINIDKRECSQSPICQKSVTRARGLLDYILCLNPPNLFWSYFWLRRHDNGIKYIWKLMKFPFQWRMMKEDTLWDFVPFQVHIKNVIVKEFYVIFSSSHLNTILLNKYCPYKKPIPKISYVQTHRTCVKWDTNNNKLVMTSIVKQLELGPLTHKAQLLKPILPLTICPVLISRHFIHPSLCTFCDGLRNLLSHMAIMRSSISYSYVREDSRSIYIMYMDVVDDITCD